jgi:hypothetical protein
MDTAQVKIVCSLAISYGFAVIFSAARFLSRYVANQGYWLDDYLIIPAFVRIRQAELMSCADSHAI